MFRPVLVNGAGPGGGAACGVGLRRLVCSGCGFEPGRRHGYLSVVFFFVVVQVGISATDKTLVQGSPGVCECVPLTLIKYNKSPPCTYEG